MGHFQAALWPPFWLCFGGRCALRRLPRKPPCGRGALRVFAGRALGRHKVYGPHSRRVQRIARPLTLSDRSKKGCELSFQQSSCFGGNELACEGACDAGARPARRVELPQLLVVRKRGGRRGLLRDSAQFHARSQPPNDHRLLGSGKRVPWRASEQGAALGGDARPCDVGELRIPAREGPLQECKRVERRPRCRHVRIPQSRHARGRGARGADAQRRADPCGRRSAAVLHRWCYQRQRVQACACGPRGSGRCRHRQRVDRQEQLGCRLGRARVLPHGARRGLSAHGVRRLCGILICACSLLLLSACLQRAVERTFQSPLHRRAQKVLVARCIHSCLIDLRSDSRKQLCRDLFPVLLLLWQSLFFFWRWRRCLHTRSSFFLARSLLRRCWLRLLLLRFRLLLLLLLWRTVESALVPLRFGDALRVGFVRVSGEGFHAVLAHVAAESSARPRVLLCFRCCWEEAVLERAQKKKWEKAHAS